MVKMLVVDDEEQIRSMFTEYFSLKGFEIDAVASGEEALRVIDGSYDVIVADINMPGMSGLELLGEINNRHDLDTVRKIAMTGDGMADITDVLDLGVSDLLVKPISIKETQERVEAAVTYGGQYINCRKLISAALEFGDDRPAASLLDYIYTRRPKGFVGIDEDSEEGVAVAGFHTIKRFPANNHPVIIQIVKDYESRLGINIARMMPKAYTHGDSTYMLEEYIPGVNGGDLLRRLSENDSPQDQVMKRTFLDKMVADLVTWQKNYHTNMDSRPDRTDILSRLLGNLGAFFQNCETNTTKNVSRGRDAYFSLSLTLFDLLALDGDTMVRYLDNSPQNCGVKFMPKRRKTFMNELLESWSGSQNMQEWLSQRFFHWDTGTRFTHELEDFIALYDSYEADLPYLNVFSGESGYNLFNNYMSLRHGDKRTNPLDIMLIGYYRNTRKRDLIIDRYYRKNEMNHTPGNQNHFEMKRDEYVVKVKHYDARAQYYARVGFEHFLGKEGPDTQERLRMLRARVEHADALAQEEILGIDNDFAREFGHGPSDSLKFLYLLYISRLSMIESHSNIRPLETLKSHH